MQKFIFNYLIEYPHLISNKKFFSLVMLMVFLVLGAEPVEANISKYIDFKKFERLENCGTVTDIDGNVYETVLVAGECWIKSNLKVKHYRNGDPIPEIQDQQEWTNATTGAWCYYDNDPANEDKYGLLYNFYAVADPRGLAPEDWEVPDVCAFQDLINLYGYEVSGDKIKDPNEWPVSIYDNPDNESGLTVIPAGIRTSGNPDFQGNGDWGNYVSSFWTSTKLSSELSFFANTRHETSFFGLDASSYQIYFGLSVRTTKIKELPQDPSELVPEEIFQCELTTAYEFMFDFPDLVERTVCPTGGSYIYDTYLCYELYNVKIFKADISSEPIQSYDKFEHDVTYYFMLGNQSNDVIGGYPIIYTCNIEYKAFVFKMPLLPAPDGDPEQFFCSPAKISDFVVTGEDLIWYDAAEVGNALSEDEELEDGRVYYVSQKTDGCESAERLEVTARISQLSVPTGAAVQEFCHQATIGDLEVEGDNIQWYDAEGTLLPASAGLEHDAVYRAVTKEGDCESEAMEIRVVLKNTPAPQADAVQVFCNQAFASDFEAAGENIRWYNDQFLTELLDLGTALEDLGSYFVTQTVDGCESQPVEVQVTINAPEKPTGEADQEFCGSANLSDLIVTGENIRWYEDQNDTEAITADMALEDGRAYYATQTVGGCESAERLEVRVKINSPSGPAGATVQEFCFTATVSELVVEGNDVIWYDSEGNPLVPSDILSHNGIYRAVSREGDCESGALEIRIVLKNTPAPQTEAVQVFCNQAFISDLEATGENIRWYKDQSLTELLDTGTALENQGSYFVTQTVDGCESAPAEVKVTINAPEKPTAETDQEFCGSANLSDLIITGENIRWYAGQNDTQAIIGDIALEDGRTYYATQTLGDCESAERLGIKVLIYRPERPVGESLQSVCEGALLEELTIDGIGLTWYEAEAGVNPLPPTTMLADGRSYFVSQTVGGCESERLGVRVEILPSLQPMADDQQIFCASSAPKVKDLFAVGEQVLWYLSETGGNPLSDNVELENGISYYASNFNTIGCESPLRKKVEVMVQVCEVEVYNLVTLDGNDRNAYFKIKDIEYFPENRLEIFNRYGVLVYSQDSYGQEGNFFYGMSNASGVRDAAGGLPTGNYLYVLTYKIPADGRTEKVNGYLHLINTKR